jgi:Tfp pilus assembly protein PilF
VKARASDGSVFWWGAAFVTVTSSARVQADRRADAKAPLAFGITVAQQGLWREVQYRCEWAIEIDPTYAATDNNLAVAYEQLGRVDHARLAYEKALAPRTARQV